MNKFITLLVTLLFNFQLIAETKILIVSTSHSNLGNSGYKTGLWLSEASHPYKILTEAGYEVDIASIKGGKIPLDPSSLEEEDSINQWFLNNEKAQNKIQNSTAIDDIEGSDYAAIIFSGGHDSVWDYYPNDNIERIGFEIQKRNGVIAAVCHGVAALLSLKTPDNEPYIQNKSITGFSNSEEIAIKLDSSVPYSLEDRLKSQGAQYFSGEDFTSFVTVDDNLVTGQNPQSSTLMANKVLTLLKAKNL